MQMLNANLGPLGRNPGGLPLPNSEIRQAERGGVTQRRQNLNQSISTRIDKGNQAKKANAGLSVYQPKSAGGKSGATLKISDSARGDVIDTMG